MARAPSRHLLAALRALNQSFVCPNCLHAQRSTRVATAGINQTRSFLSDPSKNPNTISTKEQRKQVSERKRQVKDGVTSLYPSPAAEKEAFLAHWELTVGIEIHAELNTTSKLFSTAATSLADAPNTHVAVFDAALPGAQPQFQTATLLPAVRAALALGCEIQRKSSWDRKHYFWWDQPNGYQITQYYEPFARNGEITLYQHDDIDPADYPQITIGIKQIQMEQDTAKTTLQPPNTNLLDFNRVSTPLIEIITLPQIHSPKTAAALVKKIQAILKTIDANTTGMEMGGLRADVNVSVRPRNDTTQVSPGLSYGGVTGLGQRTEIKNLNSFKAVEDAIKAERDRQISILQDGGTIEGETRGWTVGGTQTRRIRGKEGEVDYRYMPDPDLGPLIIGQDLIDHLKETLPPLPDESLRLLATDPRYGVTLKDARTLLTLDNGERLDYYFTVVDMTYERLVSAEASALIDAVELSNTQRKVGPAAANWVLHELGALLSNTSDGRWSANNVSPSHMAQILYHRLLSHITQNTAKQLLWLTQGGIFDIRNLKSRLLQGTSDRRELELLEAQAITQHIHDKDLMIRAMADKEYIHLAMELVSENPDMAGIVRQEITEQPTSHSQAANIVDNAPAETQLDKKQKKNSKSASGKMQWFVGKMLARGDTSRMMPHRCDSAIRTVLTQTR